jgi:endoglucanase
MNLPSRVFAFLFFFLLFVACKPDAVGIDDDSPTTDELKFVHTMGKLIVDGENRPINLKGIAFGNEVWSDRDVPETHHNEEDFVRVKNMNMNVIRFYLNYKTLESDNAPYQYKSAGWDWLDKNLGWAKKHGIYLILNMHVPQGGFQSMGNGDALWNIPANQDRLVALWKAIAGRYKNETQIIGFGLVNEPVPTTSKQQWQQLAQRITNAIRGAEAKQIIFAERCLYVKSGEPEGSDLNFPLIEDKHVVYEFHTYDPFSYTHQMFTWANLGEGGKYPDDDMVSYTNANWHTATFDNRNLGQGDTDWTYVEGVKYKITDPKIKLAIPALVGANVGGRVYFDDLVIKEYNEQGVFVRDIISSSLDDLLGWGYWSQNNSGKSGLAVTGRSNNKSLYIEAGTSDCNFSNYEKVFVPKPNHSYQVNGWMRGQNVSTNAACKFRIDFLATNDPVVGRNKTLLENSLKRYIDWAKAKNLPVYMGEFGVGVHCFQNNKGGIEWVKDMVDIAQANQIAFTYHVYHEDNFGLYFGYGTLPNPANVNQPLIDFFKARLR